MLFYFPLFRDQFNKKVTCEPLQLQLQLQLTWSKKVSYRRMTSCQLNRSLGADATNRLTSEATRWVFWPNQVCLKHQQAKSWCQKTREDPGEKPEPETGRILKKLPETFRSFLALSSQNFEADESQERTKTSQASNRQSPIGFNEEDHCVDQFLLRPHREVMRTLLRQCWLCQQCWLCWLCMRAIVGLTPAVWSPLR